MARSSTSSIFSLPSFQRPPPAHFAPAAGDAVPVEMECNNVPLNLTVSSNKSSSAVVKDQHRTTSSPTHHHHHPNHNFSGSPRHHWNESVTREDPGRHASVSPRNRRNLSSSPATNHNSPSFPLNISSSLRFTGNRNSPISSVLSGSNSQHASLNKTNPWSHQEQSLLGQGNSWENSKNVLNSTKWSDPADKALFNRVVTTQDNTAVGFVPPRSMHEMSNSPLSYMKYETSASDACIGGTQHPVPPLVRANMRTFTTWRSVDPMINVGERSPNQTLDRTSDIMSDSPPASQGCRSLAGDVRHCHLKDVRHDNDQRISAAGILYIHHILTIY